MSSIAIDTDSTTAESLEAEYGALTERVGFRLLDDRMIVRVTGDDRVSFFHGMCSADVKGAHPGDVVPALFLTEHAHVIGDAFIWFEEGALTLETDLTAWPREKEHLEKLLVADDVEMEEFHPLSILHVEGPRAADALSTVEISAVRTRSSRGIARNPSMLSSGVCRGLVAMRFLCSAIA